VNLPLCGAGSQIAAFKAPLFALFFADAGASFE
jgi:hypothetical protein